MTDKLDSIRGDADGADPGRSQLVRTRLNRAMLVLPVPVFGLVFGWEWFAEPGSAAPP